MISQSSSHFENTGIDACNTQRAPTCGNRTDTHACAGLMKVDRDAKAAVGAMRLLIAIAHLLVQISPTAAKKLLVKVNSTRVTTSMSQPFRQLTT